MPKLFKRFIILKPCAHFSIDILDFLNRFENSLIFSISYPPIPSFQSFIRYCTLPFENDVSFEIWFIDWP